MKLNLLKRIIIYFNIGLFLQTLIIQKIYAQEVISIIDQPYNAIPNDNVDDTQAIKAALKYAHDYGKSVYIPSGRFLHSAPLTINGIKVFGDGNTSILHCDIPRLKKIIITGDGASVRNLKSSTHPTSRTGGEDNFDILPEATNFIIDHVTVEGSNAGGIYNEGHNGVISNNYVTGTLADGIHNTQGASNIIIYGNVVRNTIDDMIAVVSYTKNNLLCSNILIENNDVSGSKKARGISIVGGKNITIRNNKISYTNMAGIYIVNEVNSKYKTFGISNVLIENNILDSIATMPKNTGHTGLFTSSDSLMVEDIFYTNNKVTRVRNGIGGKVTLIKVNNNSSTITARNIYYWQNTYNGSPLTPLNSISHSNPFVTGCTISINDLPQFRSTGLTAEYFNNPSLIAPAALTRSDVNVNFDWLSGTPAEGINYDNFSVRWRGQIEAPVDGNYTFTTITDDGVRLWVNNIPVINNWTDHSRKQNSATVPGLRAGQKYDITMEYYDKKGGAVAILQWAYPGQIRQVIPINRIFSSKDLPSSPNTTSEETSQLNIEERKSSIDNISIYPNPASSLLNIDVFAENKVRGNLLLVSAGAFPYKVNIELNLDKGINSVQIPLASFPKGLYLVVINHNNRQTIMKMFVDR